MEAKVVTLETKVARLEAKVEQQESQIAALIVNEREKQQSSTTKKFTTSVELNQNYKRNVIFRTCQELHSSNPLLESGMYWIDPDGQGVGDDAIHVFCDMKLGETSIGHDSESETDVGQCAEPGCYTKKINYYATDRQIEALNGLSSQCKQSFWIKCNRAPLKVGGIEYSFYHSKHGKQSFSNWLTGCNSGGSADDRGYLQDNRMPITQLNFGGTLKGSIKYTLRKIICGGKKKIEEMPKSCEDLWRLGHSLNGIFAVKGSKNIESVYCDFNKRPNENGFQKWIGYADVKSALVNFYVQRNTHFNTDEIPIPFDLAVVNVGNAMNLKKGIFTAPRSGTYFIAFAAVVEFPDKTSYSFCRIGLYVNGVSIGYSWVEESTVAYQRSPGSFQSTLNLKKGDQVWLQIDALSERVYLFDKEGGHYTHFTGFLLEEEIVSSL